MAFHSTTFVAFFVVVFVATWALAPRARVRKLLLLAASCVFYAAWDTRFLALLLGSALIDFVVGRAIHASEDPRRRRLLLVASLVANLGALGFFKYFGFFVGSAHQALAALGLVEAGGLTPLDIVLPVGISFYTFQTISYSLDIFRRQLAPTDSFVDFALFVAFFPQLVAGPIVRASEFLPQLVLPARYDDERVQRGVFLMLLGFVKKVALADVLGAELVDPIFADPAAFGPAAIVLCVWGALFQFYLDFSGYSDIATGAAACLGFTLPINFDRPFLARSFREFWQRWHITLSSFLRDYLFLPLLGSRSASAGRRAGAIMLTMLLAGLWHGAGWNYLIWGGLLGVYSLVGAVRARLASGREQDTERDGLPLRVAQRLVVFNLTALSMVFFRNGTAAEGHLGVQGSFDMLGALFAPGAAGVASSLGIAALAVAALIHVSPRGWVPRVEAAWCAAPAPLQAGALTLATGALAAVTYQQSPFLYFQF